jgi:hypothetical protein
MLAFGAISESPISALPDALRVTFSGAVTYTAIESEDFKLYACTEDYITRSSDTPAGTPFPGVLDKLPRFDRSIIGGDGFSGLTNGWGDAGLINVGDYDQYVRGYAVDGRRALFKAFDPTLPYANAQTVADLVAMSIGVDGQMLIVGFRDKGFKLDVPTQPNTYAGTGDTEGGPDLTGKRRNMGFGPQKNITPVRLISAEQLFEVNGGRSVQSITNVSDKGYPLSGPQADYATTALLRAAAAAGQIVDGWYSTCLADGRFAVGAGFEQITCDVEGDNAGGYVNTTGTIMRRIIGINGCISDPSEIDTVSFANLELDQPATIGYYLNENSTETVAQTFDKLTKGIGGWSGFTRLGMLQAGVFKAPSGTPAGTYTDHEILSIDVERLPSTFDPPPWRQRVPYERNWTIISDPFPGVGVADPARAAWLGTPYKVASTTQAAGDAILEDHLLAQDPNVRESYFALEADALAEANRSLTLANSNYCLYRILLKVPPFTHDIDQTIRVTDDLGRYGLDVPRLLRLPSISDIPDDNTIEVRAFG